MKGIRDGRQILSELVHYRTYAGVRGNGKKESRNQVVDRVEGMHRMMFPHLDDEIVDAFVKVRDGKAVPSMRSMQFGGIPILRSQARIYNCAYSSLQEWKDFADLFWLLMNGVGVGYSVQRQHVSKLPVVKSDLLMLRTESTFVVPDTKEGWADALLALLEDYHVKFDVSQVRPKGSPLSTGGECSGPEALLEMLESIREILVGANGRQLRPIEAFDIMCHIADNVVAGSVRRSATIALFSDDDEEMMAAKSGDFFDHHPHRMRANISAVLLRSDPDIETKIRNILLSTQTHNTGEPGIFLTNDLDYGTNPCCEISLKNRQLCNLTEVNVAACETTSEFYDAIESASAIGTLQAAYTDFEYIHPDWSKNCKEEALLGVSLTGQAENWDLIENETVLVAGAMLAQAVNARWAEKLGINQATRVTTTKPSGNTSAWLGTTSGIHAAHAPYFLRRMRVDRKSAFGKYLIDTYGVAEANTKNFLEWDAYNKENVVISVPINMAGAIMREEETALDLLERTKHIYNNWVQPGHRVGPNTHNVSLTVNYRPDEYEAVVEWMVANRNSYSGISLFPYDGGDYPQKPFEEITEGQFYEYMDQVPVDLHFSDLDFTGTKDVRIQELACAGGACEVT